MLIDCWAQLSQHTLSCNWPAANRLSEDSYQGQESSCWISYGQTVCANDHCCFTLCWMKISTRKLCYRKDDRAMHPIYGCPENFRDPLTTPTATIPNIFHGLLFGSTLWMFLQNLKSVALSVPQIIGGIPKIWTVPGYALAPFSRKFLIAFYSDWPYKCTRQICSP